MRMIWIALLSLWSGAAFGSVTFVDLGTADLFNVLAGSTVTNTGQTVIHGNVGVWPGTSVTGFPPGVVSSGVIDSADAVAHMARTDLIAAL